MKHFVIRSFVIGILLIYAAAVSAQNDIKIRQRMTAGGQTFESTVMIKGARERTETSMMGMQNISVMECDLRRTLYISDADKKYYIEPMAAGVTTAAPAAPMTSTTREKTKKGGTVVRTIEIIDTGERQQMFGMTARHIRTIMTTEPSADACEKDKQRMETDGWYVDLAVGLSCKSEGRPSSPMSYNSTSCHDQEKLVQKGTAKLGYPLKVTTKFAMDDDDESDPQMAAMMSMSTEVVELSRANLPQSLFDVPAGYTEAASRGELMGRGSAAAMGSYPNKSSAAGTGNSPAYQTPSNTTTAKRAGVIRIGVVIPANSSGKPLNTISYQSMLVSSISSDKVEAVAASSEADAQKMNCDYVLTTDIKTLKQSTASKIGGMFGKVTGTPAGGGKVEATIAYALKGVAGSASTTLQSEVTAKVEGEDASVSSAISSEAQAVMKALKK